jgi:integration host factor subunit beta
MTRFELIQKLVEDYPHLYASDVQRVVAAIFDEIATALSRGDRVEPRGFGKAGHQERRGAAGPQPAIMR